MTMPGDIFFGSIVSYFGINLEFAVDFGTVPQSRVDVSRAVGCILEGR